jgi:hypothetical protein
MLYLATYEFIRAIKEALEAPVRSRNWSIQPWAETAASDGWCLLGDVSDVMERQDPRIYHLERHMNAACETFRLPVRGTMSRPMSPHSEGMILEGLSVIDAAALMVSFEHLGFTLDPSPLIELLRNRLGQQNRYSMAELELLFHLRIRNRTLVTLSTQREPVGGCTTRMRGALGHRIRWQVGESNVASLTVRGPQYRPPRARVEHTCDYCGLTFTRGDLEASIEHRVYHRRIQRCFDPAPLAKLRRRIELAANGDVYVVDQDAPKWMHTEMYERAVMFKREMEFDFVQWNTPPRRGRTTEEGVGYLLCTPDAPVTIAGACAFRERAEGWTMDWAWIAPRYRRTGLMRGHWPRFVERYGDFLLEHPLSDAMQSFVSANGTPGQMAMIGSMVGGD